MDCCRRLSSSNCLIYLSLRHSESRRVLTETVETWYCVFHQPLDFRVGLHYWRINQLCNFTINLSRSNALLKNLEKKNIHMILRSLQTKEIKDCACFSFAERICESSFYCRSSSFVSCYPRGSCNN